MDIMAFLRDQIRRAIPNRFRTVQELAIRAGVSQPNLSNFLSGKRSGMTLETGWKLLEALGMDLIGVSEEASAGRSNPQTSEYDFIPKVTARAGAGSSLITSGETEGLYAFRKAFMGLENIAAAHSVLLDVLGDSMFPLLRDGDTILVDQSDKDPRDGLIYLVTLRDELLVKRVHKTARGLLLHSEHPSFPDIPVEEPDFSSFTIHGRVRWFGRVI